jgi:DNA-binding transcriptional MerR regulator
MLNIGDFARLAQVSPRTLRHYDDLGLLRPERVDQANGYRSYGVGQLARLHRIVALRDLGFALDEIGELLLDESPVEQLRAMLRVRRLQIEQGMAEEQARLLRVEAHLRAIERSTLVPANVVIKTTQPIRIAEASGTASGFGPLLGDIFERLGAKVWAAVERASIKPGLMVAWYEQPQDDGRVTVHFGCEVGSQRMQSDDEVHVVDLPVIEVASVVHKGSMEDVVTAYEELVRWVEDSGYGIAGRSRELYHEWHDDDPARNLTELQMPIAR